MPFEAARPDDVSAADIFLRLARDESGAVQRVYRMRRGLRGCERLAGAVSCRSIAAWRDRDKTDQGNAAARRDAGRGCSGSRGAVASAKDRAENLMIVDLLRNDISRVAVPGTRDACRCCMRWRVLPSVHHLVSVVEGLLAAGLFRRRSAARGVSWRVDYRRAEECARWKSLPSWRRRARSLLRRGGVARLRWGDGQLISDPHGDGGGGPHRGAGGGWHCGGQRSGRGVGGVDGESAAAAARARAL